VSNNRAERFIIAHSDYYTLVYEMKTDSKSVLYWFRWFALPAFVFGAFIATGILAEVPVTVFGLWEDLWVGIACAVTWVLTSFFIAPEKKTIVSTVFFVLGALLAWILVGKSWYPESHPRAYQHTYIPFALTFISGLSTLALLAIIKKRKPTMHLEPISKR